MPVIPNNKEPAYPVKIRTPFGAVSTHGDHPHKIEIEGEGFAILQNDGKPVSFEYGGTKKVLETKTQAQVIVNALDLASAQMEKK